MTSLVDSVDNNNGTTMTMRVEGEEKEKEEEEERQERKLRGKEEGIKRLNHNIYR